MLLHTFFIEDLRCLFNLQYNIVPYFFFELFFY
jgi:hypothetical protein